MPSNIIERVNEIHKIAEIFRQRGCIETNNLINTFAVNVKEGKSISNKEYENIFNLFRNEYSDDIVEIVKIYDFIIMSILIPIIKNKANFREKFHELHSWFQSYKERVILHSEYTQETLKNVNVSKKLRFINLCIIYGWLVEAFFAEALRILLIFVNLGYDNDLKYDQVRKKSIKTIRKELNELTASASEFLFSAYEDGHLRNSIFHFRFKYDNSTQQMNFQDMKGGEMNYNKSFTFQEFKKYTLIQNSVDELLTLSPLIIRIGDLIF